MPIDAPNDGTVQARERRVRAAGVACALVGALPVFLTAGLAVQIGRDITLGPSRLGIASGVFFAAAAAGSAQMGRVAERLGPGLAMRSAIAVSGLVLTGMVVVPNYGVLLALLTVGGLANSLAQVGANLLVARAVAPQRQGWALALKQAGVPAGTLLGGLAVPVVGVTVGWRWAFVGGIGLAVAAGLLVPVRAVPAGGRRRSRGREGDVPLRPLVLLAVAVGFAAGANGCLATFLVSAGVDAGLGESASGLVLMGGSAIGISMRLVAGVRADRRGGRHLPVVSLLLVGGSLGYVLLAPGSIALHLLGSVIAFGSGWSWPGLFNLAVVRLNPSAPAAATGITQTGVYVGALTGPVVFGLIVDSAGYPWAWLVAAVWSGGAAAALVVGRRAVLRWRDLPPGPGKPEVRVPEGDDVLPS